MMLSPEAKEFEKWFIDRAAQHLAPFHRLPKDVEQPYGLDVWIYLDRLKLKSKPGYKKNDATNRMKLLEDCVMKAVGVGDENNLDVFVHKREDPENPRVVLFVVPLDPDYYMPTMVDILERG